jgi:hypothetical protein
MFASRTWMLRSHWIKSSLLSDLREAGLSKSLLLQRRFDSTTKNGSVAVVGMTIVQAATASMCFRTEMRKSPLSHA